MAEERKPMRQVTGAVNEKDESLWTQFKRLFFAESIETVKDNVFKRVIVPNIKHLVADAFMGTIYGSLFGSDAPKTSGYTYTSYGSLTRPSASKSSYEPYYKKAQISEINNTLYEPVVFRTWAKCRELVDILEERIRETGNVRITDLNEAVVDEKGNSRIGKSTDPMFGWTSLKGYDIVQHAGDRWEVVLPEPVELARSDKKGRNYTYEI